MGLDNAPHKPEVLPSGAESNYKFGNEGIWQSKAPFSADDKRLALADVRALGTTGADTSGLHPFALDAREQSPQRGDSPERGVQVAHLGDVQVRDNPPKNAAEQQREMEALDGLTKIILPNSGSFAKLKERSPALADNIKAYAEQLREFPPDQLKQKLSEIEKDYKHAFTEIEMMPFAPVPEHLSPSGQKKFREQQLYQRQTDALGLSFDAAVNHSGNRHWLDDQLGDLRLKKEGN
ncbi:MAG TPA: hypothetical protein V6C97_24040 [Oculatellaceae cyanobacterium]